MAEELKTNNMPNFKENPDGMKPSGFKMKNSMLHKSAKYGSPMHGNYGSPMDKALVGDQKNLPPELKAKIKASPATKKTFGEWFKSTKLGKDLNKAGKQIKRDAAKIKKGFESPNLNPHSGEKESRVSRSIGDKKRDLNRVKRNLENKKSKFDRKLKSDLTNLGNKLFKKKSPATKKGDPKKKKATLNLDYVKKGFDKATETNYSNASANLERAKSKKTIIGALPSGYAGLTQFIGGMATEGASEIVKGVQKVSKKIKPYNPNKKKKSRKMTSKLRTKK